MSKKKLHNCSIEDFPLSRNGVVDLMKYSKKQDIVHQIFEIDVTDLRSSLAAYKKKAGNSISFTACIVYCLARAVEENKMMQAIKQKKKLIIFDDVDVSTIIEEKVEGKQFPINLTIRAANYKSLLDIHQEIRNEQAGIVNNEDKELRERLLKLFSLPRWLRVLAYRKVQSNADKKRIYYGTVGVTAVGMYSKVPSWLIPLTPLTTTLAIGTIFAKPWVVGNEIKIREILAVTLTFNHDIVDGSPVVRFISRFAELLEKLKIET